MPKSIYVDENGQKHEVGACPTALGGLIDTDIQNPTQGEVLAVDSNGKWANTDINTVATGTLTTSNVNISILRSKLIKMPNGIKFISACLQSTGAIGISETILNLPANYELVDSLTNFDLVGVSTTGTGIALYINSGNLVKSNTSVSSGVVFIINSWYR